MAITRLTDIITVFESKWTYGDTKFGYEGEVNQDHDTQYPLMLIQPPESIIPAIYNGREEYSFEINFYNLYSQAAQSVVTLQKRWDNLQDLSNEWLDLVLKNYQDVTVDAYLNDESIEIERLKDVANDKLVQIKLVFTMSAFTKCFRPVSSYPSDFSNLAIWYKADSGATFDIATKSLSKLTDQTPSSTSFVSQSTKSKQPLRYGYDGANDKTYIEFDGTNDYLTSNTNNPSVSDFTAFYVGKLDSDASETGTVFGYRYETSTIKLGSSNNKLYGKIIDGGGTTLELLLELTDTTQYHIGMFKLHNKRLYLNYDALGNSQSSSVNNASYDHSEVFDRNTYDIGFIDGGVSSDYFEGNFHELIVFNRKLEDTEIADVKKYLNDKYKIY